MRPIVSASVSEPLPFLAEAVRRAAVVRDLDDTNDGESKDKFLEIFLEK